MAIGVDEQRGRCLFLLMEGQHPAEINIEKQVPGHHEEGLLHHVL